jgi:[acyl-carrier-protein] S-malonyltransferase
MKTGIVFPGQGSQKVGMGKDLYDFDSRVREIFEMGSRVLGRDMAEICFEGPEEVLTKTENAQPCIFLVSAAILTLLRLKGIVPDVVAGHSLGEITAYYAAHVLDLKSALEIIQVRGEAMAASYPSEDSAMAAIMKVELDVILDVLKPFEGTPVVAANLNCPGQIVISGTKAGVAAASEELSKRGGRAIPLNVSGAFHSPLMSEGSTRLAAFLLEESFSDAKVPVILNRTAAPETDRVALRGNLPLQVISPVRWIECVHTMGSRVDRIIVCGHGKVLTGLCKKILPDMSLVSVSDLEGLNGL